jgi:hypothetical protein
LLPYPAPPTQSGLGRLNGEVRCLGREEYTRIYKERPEALDATPLLKELARHSLANPREVFVPRPAHITEHSRSRDSGAAMLSAAALTSVRTETAPSSDEVVEADQLAPKLAPLNMLIDVVESAYARH